MQYAPASCTTSPSPASAQGNSSRSSVSKSPSWWVRQLLHCSNIYSAVATSQPLMPAVTTTSVMLFLLYSRFSQSGIFLCRAQQHHAATTHWVLGALGLCPGSQRSHTQGQQCQTSGGRLVRGRSAQCAAGQVSHTQTSGLTATTRSVSWKEA
jgi:hypothetical protein